MAVQRNWHTRSLLEGMVNWYFSGGKLGGIYQEKSQKHDSSWAQQFYAYKFNLRK